ncbi:hypothetical protein N9L68_08905 [bacterium]|nr:hypothetical protein [bacterium]
MKVAAKLVAEAACAQAAWGATKRQLEVRQQRLKLEQELSHSQRQLLELRQKQLQQLRQLDSRRQQLLQQQRQPEQLEPTPTPPPPPALQIPMPPRYPHPPHMVLLRIHRTRQAQRGARSNSARVAVSAAPSGHHSPLGGRRSSQHTTQPLTVPGASW